MAGDLGPCALPGGLPETRAAIDEAVACARAMGCGAVHVMDGRTDGGPAAEAAFRATLAHACAAIPDRGESDWGKADLRWLCGFVAD